MSPTHSPTLSFLLLTILLATPPFSHAGGSSAPANFNSSCVSTNGGEFPDTQRILTNLDYYDDLTFATSIYEPMNGWTVIDEGTCDNSLMICDDALNAVNNSLQVFIDPAGPTDPVHNELKYTCQNCTDCILEVTIVDAALMPIESIVYTCSDVEQTQDYTFPMFFSVQYRAIFGSSASRQCITLNRERVYYYQNCPTVFNLTEYPPENLGLGPLDALGCVDNAVSSDTVRANCSDTSEWEQVSSSMCECSGGFEPNNNRTVCSACAENHLKPDVGNSACDMCPSGSERMSGDTVSSCSCTGNLVTVAGATTTTTAPCNTCAEGYRRLSDELPSAPCNLCAVNFFKSGEQCVACPTGSERTGDNEDSCMCTGNLVTDGGVDTTTGALCDNCMDDYFLIGGDCQACPDDSVRLMASDVGECICTGNTVTTGSSSTTMGDPCSDCAQGFARDSMSDMCTGIVVSFSAMEYTFDEEADISLSVTASPPPSENIEISLSSPSEIIKFKSPTVTLSSSNPTALIEISPIDDDIALQSARNYTVTFDTNSDVNKDANMATITINDNDDVVAMFSDDTDYKVSESAGHGEVEVKLSRAVAIEVEVRVTGAVSSTVNTEPSASSLSNLSVVLTFEPNGGLSKSVKFSIVDDTEGGEDDEQYKLTLVKVTPNDNRFSIGESVLFVFIEDDDAEDEEDDEPAAAFPLEAIIGVCVGGALLAVLVSVLCLVFLCIWRLNVNRQGFYPTNEDKHTAPTMLRYSASLRSISSQTVVAVEGKQAGQKENEFFV